MITMKSFKKVVKTKKRNLKKSPDKNKNRDSNRNITNVTTARKQNDKRSQTKIKTK